MAQSTTGVRIAQIPIAVVSFSAADGVEIAIHQIAIPRYQLICVVVRLMLYMSSPLQRALLQSAAALAPRGRRVTDVQHVFDHYAISLFAFAGERATLAEIVSVEERR